MVYKAGEWEHGLRCADCETDFIEGQPISEYLEAMQDYGDEPVPVVVLVCGSCAMGNG